MCSCLCPGPDEKLKRETGSTTRAFRINLSLEAKALYPHVSFQTVEGMQLGLIYRMSYRQTCQIVGIWGLMVCYQNEFCLIFHLLSTAQLKLVRWLISGCVKMLECWLQQSRNRYLALWAIPVLEVGTFRKGLGPEIKGSTYFSCSV